MTIAHALLAAVLSLPAYAQPEAPPASDAKTEAPKSEAPAPAAATAPKEEAPPAPPPAKPAKPAKTEEAKPADAGTVGCCKPLDGVSDAYRQSWDRMKEFVKQSSEQVADVERRTQELRSQIEAKEAAVTKLKFESSKESKKKVKELEVETKGLWRELDKLDRERKTLCKGIARAAAQKVRELGTDIGAALSAAQQQMNE